MRNGQTGLDGDFKAQVRMTDAMREGVEIDDYLGRMDRAGIARSLLLAVRAGDLRVRGSFEIPYARVHEVCAANPDRFSGLAGIDPTRGMQGLRDLESGRARLSASSARICIRTGSAGRRTTPSTIRTTPNAANSASPS